MSKLVAVKGAVISFEPVTVLGTDTVGKESSKLLVQGKGVYTQEIKLSISAISNIIDGSVAPGTFNGSVMPTASKLFVEGGKVVLANDVLTGGNDSGAAQKPGPNGAPAPSPISFTRKVLQAGQVKLCAK
ncbi:hypothetical protein [Alteromonas sp. a30]|uniref:hypothetical protein n=1 Tax=Alteromonas sp. a30 TaxID=2730917 RepID=UPI002280D3CA|nr:hypothetical protein [Alteromonas sp. a30]MCY7296503.1 hypothetical protein [Alteromonas sp. a30]